MLARKDWIPKKTSHRLLQHSKSSKSTTDQPDSESGTATQILRSKCGQHWKFWHFLRRRVTDYSNSPKAQKLNKGVRISDNHTNLEIKIKLTDNENLGNFKKESFLQIQFTDCSNTPKAHRQQQSLNQRQPQGSGGQN